ncbi:hypothetical protein Tco_1089081 [Tanacetum coccineum]
MYQPMDQMDEQKSLRSAENQDDDDEQTDSDNDGDDFVHLKLSTYDDEARQDEEVNDEESNEESDDESNKESDEEVQGANIEEEGMGDRADTMKRLSDHEFYRDVGTDFLQKRKNQAKKSGQNRTPRIRKKCVKDGAIQSQVNSEKKQGPFFLPSENNELRRRDHHVAISSGHQREVSDRLLTPTED